MEEVEKKFYDFSLVCRNCDKETLTPVKASVTGTIPEYAHGTYIYNGPGLSKIGDAEYKHAFDSAAILQKVLVSPEGCWYSSRYLQTETLARNRSAGTITVAEFGTGAVGGGSKGIFAKMRQLTDTEKLVSDNASVNVVTIGGRLYAMGETPYQHEVDPDTMEIKNKVNLYRDLSLITQCGHPVCDDQGNTLTVAQSIGLTGPKYVIVMFPKDGGAAPHVVARISPRWRLSPCYMHSVGITKNYMVLIEQPLAVSVKDALTDIFNSTPFMDCIKWHDEMVFIHVLDMRTWKLVKTRYVLSTCFMLHFANCYEEDDGSIVIDFPSYNDSKMLRFMFIDQLKAVNGANIHEACELFNNCVRRVVLPSPATETSAEVTVTAQTLTDATGVENPVVNPNYRRRRHRYVYGSGHSPSGNNHGRISKIDVESNEVTWFFEEDLYFSEVIFLPKPGFEGAEDDGVLVCSASFSSKPNQGCLVMLDTRTLKEVARVSFTALADVPMPLHGIFLPNNTAGSVLNGH